jgi:hypothetical protein
MKKLVLLMMLLVMASVAVKAQEMKTTVTSANATLIQPAGSKLYYGEQVMNKKECVDFLKSRHQPAYEKFQSGYKCYTAGWSLAAVGLALDLAGSIISAYAPEGDDVMFYTGAGCIIAGATIVLAAAIPTVFVGYARMNKGIDQFNMAQASAKPQAYWTIQGSQNGVGLALHF